MNILEKKLTNFPEHDGMEFIPYTIEEIREKTKKIRRLKKEDIKSIENKLN